VVLPAWFNKALVRANKLMSDVVELRWPELRNCKKLRSILNPNPSPANGLAQALIIRPLARRCSIIQTAPWFIDWV
jgi:hypothetical protein